MAIEISVRDLDSNEPPETVVIDDDYMLITAGACYLHHTNAFANGTHVLTVKGRKGGL